MLASGALYFTPGEEALAREYAGSTTKTNPKLHQWLKARARGEHYGEKPPDTVKCAPFTTILASQYVGTLSGNRPR